MIVDKTGSIVYCNESCAKIFKYAVKDLISMDVNNLVPSNLRETHKYLISDFFKRDVNLQFYDREVLAIDKFESET